MVRDFLAYRADRKAKAWAKHVTAPTAHASARASTYYALACVLGLAAATLFLVLALTVGLAFGYFFASLLLLAACFLAGAGYVSAVSAADLVVAQYGLSPAARTYFMRLNLETFEERLSHAKPTSVGTVSVAD